MRALDEAAFAERPVSARALKRLVDERRVLGRQQIAQQRMIGMMGLQQHDARLVRATRASGDLHD